MTDTGSRRSSMGLMGSPRRVLLNDDEAEKRNRRRSRADRRRSHLVTPKHQFVIGRSSLGGESITGSTIGTPSVQSLTPEELNRQYEEWMKIAADNKINTSNTWNFALIDYFHNMTLLREGDSINFQKASCTLDGCIKIYTSRVDSVATETGKLLSGLAESHARDRVHGEDEDEAVQRKKKFSRSENTLVKDFNAITLKKFDLEFSVDPLFKKTSADFDEGGARGLLLNHLGTHEGLKIVFDASDVTPYHGDVTDEQAIDDESNVDEAPKTEEDRMEIKEDVDMMEHQSEHEHLDKEVESSDVIADTAKALDISRLKAKFSAGLQNIWQRDICPSLLNFEFSSESLDIPLFQTAVTDRDPLAIDDDTDDLEDDFFDQDLENADLVFGIDDDLDDEEEDADALRPRQASVPKQDNEEEEDYSIIPNFSEADFLASMANNTNELFSYFDNAINKNWAGPQHWKLLRPAKKTIEKTAPATQTRKEKETVVIDFLNGEDVDLNGLFAPATTSISMPRTHDRAEEQNMLPDDLHYSARRLLSLFIKPTLMFTAKGRRRYVDPDMERAGNDVDTVMREAKFAEDEDTKAQETQQDGFNDEFEGPIFNTAPGFDDDDDDDVIGGNFDDGFEENVDDNNNDIPIVFEAEDTDYGDALASATQTTVKPNYVNYAKKAKRVDVKRLKDNIWRKLTNETMVSSDEATPRKSLGGARPEGEQRFTEVISSLKKVYPKEAMKDISVSFCFICLLHLANEKNLTITGDESLAELIVTHNN